ncbi:hypothetical protein Leryth_010414 [Lithospermum erythrorhizon]|nr:hypothetical protein Leryth_010414 [Lithospermum erythrorhizon]
MVTMLVFGNEVMMASATCKAVSLSSCLPAIQKGSAPSLACCTHLKLQQGCLCQYVKHPSLGKYVNSPNAKKIASTCGIPIPKC